MKALNELGIRIRSERIAQERKQKELADLAAVSSDALASLEHGRPVTTETLAKILGALGYGEALENVVPAPVISPIDLQKLEGKKRQRVR